VLGLALDLSLRNLDNDHTLDGFMRLVWQTYGKTEIHYDVRDLQSLLANYTNKAFSDYFFNSYVFDSKAPDYKLLLNSVGVSFQKSTQDKPFFGASLRKSDSVWTIVRGTTMGGPAYNAGLDYGHKIISINNINLSGFNDFSEALTGLKSGDTIDVTLNRFGEESSTKLVLGSSPDYQTDLIENVRGKLTKTMVALRNSWLSAK